MRKEEKREERKEEGVEDEVCGEEGKRKMNGRERYN